VSEKPAINPMHLAKRCKARSKRTGLPCRSPAVRGWKVCRMHGARGGARTGRENGNYRHGDQTTEARASMKAMRALAKLCRQTIVAIEGG
jgi:hypothetical protein